MNISPYSSTKYLLLIAVGMLVLGCSTKEDKWTRDRPQVYSTFGQVLFNGEPVAGATITFQPVDAAGKGGAAVTDEDGRFSAQTFEPGDGLTEGVHRVAIQKTQMVDRDGNVVTVIHEPGGIVEKNFLPAKYAKFDKSGIEVQINVAKGNDLGQINLTK